MEEDIIFVNLNDAEAQKFAITSTKKRLREMASIRIYEDKRVERIEVIEKKVDSCITKLDIVIKMLTKIGYRIDR